MHRRRAIDRYLAEGLGAAAESRLRAHLRTCEQCRRYYDEQVLLHRALAGSVGRATAAEAERVGRLALRDAGVQLPEAPRHGLASRLLGGLPWVPQRPLAFAAAALVVVAAGVLLLRPPPLAARVAEVERAQIEGKPAAVGAEILAGAEVEISAGGAMELTLERGGRVRLFPGTRLSFSARGERVDLSEGKVWCEVERTGGVFAVRTDSAEARVLGTSFLVEKQAEGATEVRVLGGSVEVEDAQGKGKVVVKGGQKSRVAAGAAPSAAVRYVPDEDRLEWDRVAREIGHGIKQGIDALKQMLNRK